MGATNWPKTVPIQILSTSKIDNTFNFLKQYLTKQILLAQNLNGGHKLAQNHPHSNIEHNKIDVPTSFLYNCLMDLHLIPYEFFNTVFS